MTSDNVKVLLMLGVAAGVGYVIYRISSAAGDAAGAVGAAIGKVAEEVNPFNNDNAINRAATGIYQGVTGSKGTIGTDIYDGVQGIGHRIEETNKAMREEEFGWPI